MNKKKTLLILIIALLVLLIPFRYGLFRNSKSEFVQIINRFVAGNRITIYTNEDIDKDKIKISCSTNDNVYFENGHKKNKIEDGYGGPSFGVFYDDVVIGRVFHYNTNDWYVNHYVFTFFMRNGNPEFSYYSKGPNHKSDMYEVYVYNSDTIQYIKLFDFFHESVELEKPFRE